MTGAAQAFALLFVAMHMLALFAYTLRWLWIAMLSVALLINAISAARSEELIEPTPQEAIDIQTWIPASCCRTKNCCRKVVPSALIPLANNEVRVATTGQVLPRTGWSQDKNTWRCTCDYREPDWIVHPGAKTHCVFDHPQSY